MLTMLTLCPSLTARGEFGGAALVFLAAQPSFVTPAAASSSLRLCIRGLVHPSIPSEDRDDQRGSCKRFLGQLGKSCRWRLGRVYDARGRCQPWFGANFAKV
jgi:hypothetical protein